MHVKTVPVRIRADQLERLKEIFGSDLTSDMTNKTVQRGLDNWLNDEGPVYEETRREERDRLAKKRQDVRPHN